MKTDPALEYDIRACHAVSRSDTPYELWRESQIATFRNRFPHLSISSHPNTFLIWLRANANALSLITEPPRTLH